MAEPNTTKAPATRDYVARWPVSHNGEDYNAADVLNLTDAEAKPLLDAGCIVIKKTGKTEGVSNG